MDNNGTVHTTEIDPQTSETPPRKAGRPKVLRDEKGAAVVNPATGKPYAADDPAGLAALALLQKPTSETKPTPEPKPAAPPEPPKKPAAVVVKPAKKPQSVVRAEKRRAVAENAPTWEELIGPLVVPGFNYVGEFVTQKEGFGQKYGTVQFLTVIGADGNPKMIRRDGVPIAESFNRSVAELLALLFEESPNHPAIPALLSLLFTANSLVRIRATPDAEIPTVDKPDATGETTSHEAPNRT